MLHSALAEEEEERMEKRERKEAITEERTQRERVVLRMGAGRVAGRILVTSARRDNLATRVVKKDILESSRLEVYKQLERA